MSIWRWAARLPAGTPERCRVTLGEGDTPVIRSRRIGESVGAPNLFFKIETSNPTGSYKDRFAAAAIADMSARGKRRCIATSSGNTGAALAAYCAAAGITCEVVAVEAAPQDKLRQMMAYGARVYAVRGFGADADVTRRTFERVVAAGTQADAALQISAYCYSPIGMSGVQTIGYEITEQIAMGVEDVFVPAGGGGLTLAVARGLNGTGARIHCVQPEGNATIAGPLHNGDQRARSVVCATQISGLQVPSVLDGDDVIAACRASGGTGHLVTDSLVWDVQRRLAREEGIFCEPAGAVSVAGALVAIAQGRIERTARICCIVTGSGFKDAAALDRMVPLERFAALDLDKLPLKP